MFVRKENQTALCQFVPQIAAHKVCKASVCSLVSNQSQSRRVGGIAFTAKTIHAQCQIDYGNKNEHDTLVWKISKTDKSVSLFFEYHQNTITHKP